MVKGVVFQPYY